MNIILSLYFTACLQVGRSAAIVNDCQKFHLVFDPYQTSYFTCVMHAQEPLAAWQSEREKKHLPYLRITRWWCKIERPGENI